MCVSCEKKRVEINGFPVKILHGDSSFGIITPDGNVLIDSLFSDKPSTVVNQVCVLPCGNEMFRLCDISKVPMTTSSRRFIQVGNFIEDVTIAQEEKEGPFILINKSSENIAVIDSYRGVPVRVMHNFRDGLALAYTGNQTNVTNKDYLFTAQVTKAYMARFLFWTQDWESAITYAKEVLEQYPMLEAEEYSESINQKFSKGKNIIMASYTTEDDMGVLNYTSAQSTASKRPVCQNLVELLNNTPNDVRKTNAFNAQRIPTKKVTTKFRSEELCLIIAESYAHLNNTTEALKYLNLLRSKRITQNYIAYTMDNLPEVFKQTITTDATGAPLSKLISAILCERRKELFLEGDRWFELKRNGRPEFWIAAMGKKYVTEKYLYTYPIPKVDIDLFPGLIIQNPGYTN